MEHRPGIRSQPRSWVYLLLLAVVVLVSLLRITSTPAVEADPQARQVLAILQTCTGVQATPNFSEYYGSVSLDGAAAPAGTLVEAYSPRGHKVGCVPVGIPGFYPYMRVYGEDGPTPGMRHNEPVTFKLGGNLATTDPSPVIWVNDWDQHPVNLAAVAATTSAQISPGSGGALDSVDGHVHLEFSAGAVTNTTTITYTAQPAPAHALGSFQFAGRSFTLEATAGGQAITHFTRPFTLTLSYADADWQAAGIADENQLNLYYWDGTDWVGLLPCDGCSLDTVNNQLTAVLDHLTEFGLLACPLTADIDHNGVVDVRDIEQAVAGWRNPYTVSYIQGIAAAWGMGCGP